MWGLNSKGCCKIGGGTERPTIHSGSLLLRPFHHLKMLSSAFTPSSTSLNYRRFLLTTQLNSKSTPSSSLWSCDGSGHGTNTHLGNVKTPFYDMDSTFQNSSSIYFRRWWSSNGNSSSRRNGIFQSGGFEPLSAIAAAAAATCLTFLLSSTPAQAGVLSGSSGLESVPFPELPGLDFLKRMQEENKKKNEAYDGQFKSSPLLQELLKRSKANSERNKQEIQDKYCERGAEWGVGDCSTIGMSTEEREAFMEMLRKKRAPN